MDMQIISQLFEATEKAAHILNLDQEFAKTVYQARLKFPPYEVGKYNQLQEWSEDFEEAEPGHRHISHLFGLFPGNQISQEQTPPLAQAARISLK
jgi:alpha-L-fucosidase 2